jgi:LAS superfamily LD-carboxypeptidase LdcB
MKKIVAVEWLGAVLLLVFLTIALSYLNRTHDASPLPQQGEPLSSLPKTTAAASMGTVAVSPLTLVNTDHPWQGGTPKGLVNLSKAISCRNIKLKNNTLEAQDEAVQALQSMADAMNASGLGPLCVTSAYRSVEYQRGLFESKVAKVIAQGTSQNNAPAVAAQEVARPGNSEHHTGYAFDLAGADFKMDSFNGSDIFRWFEIHGAEYGFVQRYPADKTDITHIVNEPWHIRYVGVKAAREMMEQHLCLEEYVEKNKN